MQEVIAPILEALGLWVYLDPKPAADQDDVVLVPCCNKVFIRQSVADDEERLAEAIDEAISLAVSELAGSLPLS